MATFREVLRIAQAALSEKDLPQQEAQLLMVELYRNMTSIWKLIKRWILNYRSSMRKE